MQYLIIFFLLQLLIAAPARQGHADVAEASMIPDHHKATQYDMSGLSEREKEWFQTFLKGNILADGWDRITVDLLSHVAADDQQQQRRLLNQLGSKIGREWCRDNDERRIDNAMLRDWGGMRKKTAKNEPQRLAEVIRHIDGEVDSLLD